MVDETLDPAILAALPTGCKIVAVNRSKMPGWSLRYNVEVEIDGEKKSYFLKIIHRPLHAEMARGEYESQKALAQYLPDNVAIPLAHGTCELDASKSFFLTPFLDLNTVLPKPAQLVKVLQSLHKESISPTGKFGFHVPTYNGIVPQLNDWCDSWEEYFTRQFRSDIAWEQSIRGPDHEFDEIAEEFFQKVIPRLLRPLQTDGRNIKPTLIHGDMWHCNTQFDNSTQQLVLFDACCCYAHNELELHMMRDPRYKFSMKGEYINEYVNVIRPSEPSNDFDDRIALYAMRDKIISSGLREDRAYLRQDVKEEMRRLLAKHPNGIDGFNDEIPN